MRSKPVVGVMLWTLCLGGLGCAGTSGTKGLSGYWVTKEAPRNFLRCRPWVQFHADGTLETNLSRSRCYVARLMAYSVRPPFLDFSQGRRRYFCRYTRPGGRLKLACGKRRVPPDFRRSIVLHRQPNATRKGSLADLAGTWQIRFYKSLSVWAISNTGRLHTGRGPATKIVLRPGHTPRRVDVALSAGRVDRCIYRVSAHHLTLCCAGRRQPSAYPASFASCRYPIVLVRKRPPRP